MSEIPNSKNINKNDLILIIENSSNFFSFIQYLKSAIYSESIKDDNTNEEFFIYDSNKKYYLINSNTLEINTEINNNLEEYFKRYGIIIFFYDSNDKNYFELIKIFIQNNFLSIKRFNSPLLIIIENKSKEGKKENECFIHLVNNNGNISEDKLFLINQLFCYYYESYISIEDDDKYILKIFNTITENYPIIKLFKNSNCNTIYKSLGSENKFNLDITIIGKSKKIDSIPNFLSKKHDASFDSEGCFIFELINIDRKLELLIHNINLEKKIKEEEIINLETHGIIYAYDLEDDQSFEYIKKFINIILSSLGNIPFLLVGFYTDESNYSKYVSKEKSLHQYIFKQENILSFIMNVQDLSKENNLLFDGIIISLVDQIFNKYPIYNYDEFSQPELYLSSISNTVISENKEINNNISQKLLEEYSNGRIKIFSCPNCLNPYYINFNEPLGLIIFNCIKCRTIPECFNLNYIKDNPNNLNEFNKFYINQNESFINYKSFFFDDNDRLYNYFCIDCQQQVFTGNNKDHFIHEGKSYNNYEFQKLISIKKEEFYKEEKYLNDLKEKFKSLMTELEEKFNLIYNTKKKINEIKKDMITSFGIIQNNYILYENFKNLKFKKPKKLNFQDIDEPEDKIKKIFEYMIDTKSQEIYSKNIIKNINVNYCKKDNNNNKDNNIIVNEEDIKKKINDICSFKYKDKDYICLNMDNNILHIYDEKMEYITELNFSSKIKRIKSLFSIYSDNNNNIFLSCKDGIKKIIINNKINSINELQDLKIMDEYKEKGKTFEYYIKLDKLCSITSTEDKQIFLLIDDENKKKIKKNITKDIIQNRAYEKIISLDKINNNIFSVKFEKVFEKLYTAITEEKRKEIQISFIDLSDDSSKVNYISCTNLIEIKTDENLNVLIKRSFIFPDSYHILGKLNENYMLIQCNNPFLQRELVLFDINNFTYIKKYKYNDSFFSIDLLYMALNNKSENINNFILFDKNLKMKINYYLPKEQEILIFNQSLQSYINYDNMDERENTKINKIIKINNRIYGIRENMKNENQLFMIDII